jgi:glycerol-3-phosphate dehydrogenase
LDARTSIEAARVVAVLMANELGRDQNWIESQIKSYSELANGYLLSDSNVSKK